MSWLLLAIIGYFLFSLATVINKFLLRQRATTKPLVFTFWIGVLSIFSVVLIPFGPLFWPGTRTFFFDILTGVFYFLSILNFYQALDINETSRIKPLTGAFTPIFVLLLSYFFLAERLGASQVLAIILLIIGGFLISIKESRGQIKSGLKGAIFIILAILTGAIYWVMAKYAFDKQGFVNGFIWTRLGFSLTSFLILLMPFWRKMIFTSGHQLNVKLGGGLVFSKLLASFGSLAVHLSLSLGSATIINAMAGTEYAFLLILTVILSLKFPRFLEEKISRKILVQKIFAIILIGAGLAILVWRF